MLPSQIEKYFESNESMLKLLKDYESAFEKVVYYQNLFKDNVISTPVDTDTAMKILGGLYSSLNSVTVAADTEKKNKEAQLYNEIVINLGKTQDKIINAVIEKEVSEKVQPIRRIRNIFQTYRDNCDKLIFICQSSLKFSEREKVNS